MTASERERLAAARRRAEKGTTKGLPGSNIEISMPIGTLIVHLFVPALMFSSDHKPICSDKLNQAHFDGELDNAFGFAMAAGAINACHEITKRRWLHFRMSSHEARFYYSSSRDNRLENRACAMGCFPHL
jgi:hypothetical protein